MRVTIVVQQLRRRVPGGIGRYAVGLLEGLHQVASEDEGRSPRVETTLLASRLPGGGASGRQRSDPLERFGLPVRTSILPGPLLVRAWDLGLLAEGGGAKVVHSVSLAAPPVRRARARRRPVLTITIHDVAWRRFPEAATRRGRRWHESALQRALRRADALVVPTEQLAGELRASGAGAVSVVPFGVDHLPTPDRDAANGVLRRLGVDGPYLLSVGTIEPRKNLSRLFEAYAKARPLLPEPWPLVVVGPRGWGGLAESVPLQGQGGVAGVLFAGPVDDEVLAGLFAGARVFVYVPLVEGFGLPALEACTFGVPVVASTGVPSVDTADDRPVALRVDPFDTDAIAAALVTGARDEPVRAAISRAGLDLSRRRTWRGMAHQYVELWESLR